MLQRILFTIAMLACSIVLTPNTVHAEDNDPLAVYVQAGIDATQHAQITDMAAQTDESNVARSHEMIQLLNNLKMLSLQPNLDEKKILATQSKINDLQGAIALDRLKLNIKVRKLLTPEQRIKLVEVLRDQRKAARQPNPN